MAQDQGKVYLVGAGPGDVGYLTVKAYHILAIAQVLVYDALVDAEILQYVTPDCWKVDVGKRGGKASTDQAKINKLLVKYCLQKKQVVRLKSGDPFIFGRCRSEIEALKAAGCDFEVIPGISSALAAPTLAGIPLTDPAISRCFAVLTAHEPDALDWEALSRLETLVILMGGQNLPEILHRLVQQGRSSSTPIAIIRSCGTKQQKIWTATLESILEKISGESLSPAVVIIGLVVELSSFLQPEKTCLEYLTAAQAVHIKNMAINIPSSPLLPLSSCYLPLANKTILVTRSVEQSNQLTQALTALGGRIIEMPALEICPPSSWETLDRAIANLSDFHWLIITSANGVDYFFERLNAQGKDVRALAGIKIAVVGKKTAQSLKQRCLEADYIPPNFVADSLAANFPEELTNKKVLFPRVESGGREVLVNELTAKGAQVVEVSAYQSCCPKDIPPSAELALESGNVDVITFASSKTVQFFCELAERIFTDNCNYHQPFVLADYLEGICIASIGPQTSKTCLSLIGRVDVEAVEYTLEGLTQALIKWAENSY